MFSSLIDSLMGFKVNFQVPTRVLIYILTFYQKKQTLVLNITLGQLKITKNDTFLKQKKTSKGLRHPHVELVR